MMAERMRIDGVDGDQGSTHGRDCPDAMPLKVDQQELDGARQTPEQWRQENRQAMKRYNERVQEHGVISDGVRCF